MKEIQNSVALREELDFLFKETAADLLAASNHVEDAFNARLVEYSEARSVAQQHLAKVIFRNPSLTPLRSTIDLLRLCFD